MNELSPLLITLIAVIAIFDAVLKLIAMWKSARNGHKAWFICLAIFNTVGILPLIYIFKNRNQKEVIQ